MANTAPQREQQQRVAREASRDNLPAPAQQTAPAEQKQLPPIVQFRDYMIARQRSLMDALPPTIPPQRFISVVMTALQVKPQLLQCTFASLWLACLRAAQDGLLPDGREGAIAPYGENKDGKRVAEIATWMPMVEGYRKKIFETGKVKSWRVDVVYENDEFDYDLANNEIKFHRKTLGNKPPGGVVGAYSIAKLASGETVIEVMSAWEIMQIKAKSKAKNGPWNDPAFFGEMCKKTVARRHYKQLPHSESMDAMIAHDDAAHGLLDEQTPPVVAPPRMQRLNSAQALDAYAGEIIDQTTGEITEEDRAGFEADQQQDQNVATTQAAHTPVAAGESDGEAGAAGRNAAPASPPTQESGPGGDTRDEGEPEQPDGADRPWPPGSLPTDEAEYERYLRTQLATITDPQAVPRWWNSDEQKKLREVCGVKRFKELQDLAVARRAELGKAS